MLPTFSQNLFLQEAFETVAQINEELKRTEFDGAFCKKFKLHAINFLHFFAKRRKSVKKMIHPKKRRGHRTSKIVKSRISSSNGYLPCHCSFYCLGRALMHDVVCEFACAVRIRIRVFEKNFGIGATAVISKILHPFKYPGLGAMSAEKMKISFTNCPPCIC